MSLESARFSDVLPVYHYWTNDLDYHFLLLLLVTSTYYDNTEITESFAVYARDCSYLYNEDHRLNKLEH